jgi:hypothetical protein
MVSRVVVEAETATTSMTELMSTRLSLFASIFLLAYYLLFFSLVILCLLLYSYYSFTDIRWPELGCYNWESKRDQVEAVLLFLFSVCFMGHNKEILGMGIGVFAGLLSIHYPLFLLLLKLLLGSFDGDRI